MHLHAIVQFLRNRW